MNSKRIPWIDIARGIGIISVLYGHAQNADSFRHLLYAFHMPLFFFLSGIVYNPKKYRDFLPFLKKNFVSTMIPYFIFALISYLIWLSARSSLPPISNMTQHAVNVIYGNSNGLFFNVVLWFLPVLFTTKILFWLITKYTLQRIVLVGVLILISVIGYVFSVYVPGVKLPLGLETAITAVVFFGAGYAWSRHAEPFNTRLQKYALPALTIFILIGITAATINFNIYGFQIDMRLNRYSNYFLFYIAAISGILSTISLSMIIKENKILEYVGKQSLVLFVWHIIVFTYFTHFLRMIFSVEEINAVRNTVLAPLFTVGGILVILSANYLYTRIKQKITS